MLNSDNYFKAYATFSECYNIGNKINGLPQGIVIHSTAAKNEKLSRYVLDEVHCGVNPYQNYMGSENAAKGGNYTTPHAVAGLDINGNFAIANILPYNIKCYGCGQGSRGSYNDTHIQIEICEDTANDRKYCEGILDLVAQWCGYICNEFLIDPDDIVSHSEAHKLGYASNHADPEHWISAHGYSLNWLRDMARRYMIKQDRIYTVQVGAFRLYDNALDMVQRLRAAGFEAFIK